MKRAKPITDLRTLEHQLPSRAVARKNLVLPLERFRPLIRLAHQCPNATTQPRIVYDFCFATFKSARGTMLLDQVSYVIEPGRILIMPPFEEHVLSFEPGMDQSHVAIHFDLAPDFPDTSKVDERLPYSVQLTDRIRLPTSGFPTDIAGCYSNSLAIVELFQQGTVLSQVAADAALFHLLATSLIHSSDDNNLDIRNPKSNRGTAIVDRVLAHMSSSLSTPLTITDLAEVGTVSTAHLTRLFRTQLGYPPMTYLARLRMIKARELLRDDRLSVKEVAHQVGYTDGHHFAREFRRFDGMSPSQYRKISASPGSV
jgi:AraC-like DNA-binding protein